MDTPHSAYLKVEGHTDHPSAVAGFILGDHRYHIWLNPETGKPDDASRMFKNPCEGAGRPVELDPKAKCNRTLIEWLLANMGSITEARRLHRESVKASDALALLNRKRLEWDKALHECAPEMLGLLNLLANSRSPKLLQTIRYKAGRIVKQMGTRP